MPKGIPDERASSERLTLVLPRQPTEAWASRLNNSRTDVFVACNDGKWDLHADHPLLTPEDKEKGTYVLTINPPGAPETPVPLHVSLSFDDGGKVNKILLKGMLGVRFASEKQCLLVRSGRVPREEARPEAPPKEMDPLATLGWNRTDCLLCKERTAGATLLLSDRQGYGFCESCGKGATATAAMRVATERQMAVGPETEKLAGKYMESVKKFFPPNLEEDETARGRALVLVAAFASWGDIEKWERLWTTLASIPSSKNWKPGSR